MPKTEQRLQVTHELQLAIVDYWHDVDTNWGRKASDHYTEDGVFEGAEATYRGRKQIQEFYRWRENRGARTAMHVVSNLRAELSGSDEALCTWYLQLYAADGVPVLPTHPPIQLTFMTDRFVRVGDRWLCRHRKFENWFVGGIPATNPVLTKMG